MNDEEGLLEFYKGKPYDAQELKELIKGMLRTGRGQGKDEWIFARQREDEISNN